MERIIAQSTQIDRFSSMPELFNFVLFLGIRVRAFGRRKGE
jgi:hypothetical protein